MYLTKDFNSIEFACKDGTPVPTSLMGNVRELAENLQVIRDHLGGERLSVLSGYRTKSHNEKVGGKTNSQHLLAKASDLTTKKLRPKQLAALIEKLILEKKIKNGGIGVYPGFVHYDIGPVRRW